MADLAEVKKILQKITMRIEVHGHALLFVLKEFSIICLQALEEKVAISCSDALRAFEPVLTCVQCQKEYTESQNGEDYCRYHLYDPQEEGFEYMYVYGILCTSQCYYNNYSFRCCNQNAENHNGCRKAKHCSKHHDNYPYAAYSTFMMDTVELPCNYCL